MNKPFVGKATVQKGGVGVTYQFTTNAASGDTFLYTVADNFGGSAQGRVNVVSYAPLAGTYSAVLADGGGTGAGFVRATLAQTGRITGTVLIAGVSYTFSGQMDAAGQFSETIKSAAPFGTKVTLSMVPNGNGYMLAAGVAMNAINLAGSMTEAVAGNAAGLYTLLIPPPTGASYVGSGYAAINVSSAGLAAISGAMPDGAPFTCASEVNGGGQIALFSPLYAPSNPGSIAGTLSLGGSGNAVLSGSLVWTKPALASAGIDQGPFAIALTGSGGRYVNVTPVLKIGANGGTGTMTLAGGNLTAPLHKTVTILNNTVSVSGAGNSTVVVTLQPATGLLSGHFVDLLTGETRQIHGIVVQGAAGSAGGYFLGDSEGGGVDIGP